MELELSSYRNKVDQMTVLLKHYQTELESQRIRGDGVDTVSRLLAEARKENVLLRRNQVVLETAVRNLQNRLNVNGLGSGPGMEDNEALMPGASKQTLTSLALENKRLRSLIQKEGSVEGNAENSKVAKDSEDAELVDRLVAENKSMKMKLTDLEALFKASNNEKDRQLVEYKEQLQQLQKSPGTTNADPSSSQPANVTFLKQQLRDFVTKCQAFENQLEEVELPKTQETAQHQVIELDPISKMKIQDDINFDGKDVKQLIEEKQHLQSRVEEVTKINERWQDFYSERAQYITNMEQRVLDLEERLKDAVRGGTSQEINRKIEAVLEKSRLKEQQVEAMRLKAEEDGAKLRQEVVTRDAQIGQLENQVGVLSRARASSGAGEAAGTIEHLKAQIQVCTEDFEKERHDRQVALGKVAALQDQLNATTRQNAHLQTLVYNQSPQPPRQAAQENSNKDPNTLQPRGGCFVSSLDYDGRFPAQAGDNRLCQVPDLEMERGNRDQTMQAQAQTQYRPPRPNHELVARGAKVTANSSASSFPGVHRSESKEGEKFLTCPKCNKEFSEDRQRELLDHMDVCWE